MYSRKPWPDRRLLDLRELDTANATVLILGRGQVFRFSVRGEDHRGSSRRFASRRISLMACRIDSELLSTIPFAPPSIRSRYLEPLGE